MWEVSAAWIAERCAGLSTKCSSPRSFSERTSTRKGRRGQVAPTPHLAVPPEEGLGFRDFIPRKRHCGSTSSVEDAETGRPDIDMDAEAPASPPNRSSFTTPVRSNRPKMSKRLPPMRTWSISLEPVFTVRAGPYAPRPGSPNPEPGKPYTLTAAQRVKIPRGLSRNKRRDSSCAIWKRRWPTSRRRRNSARV